MSSILEFQPGETEKKVTITIIDDKKIERDESFQLYLSAGEGVHLSPFPRAAITIVNNDGKDVHVSIKIIGEIIERYCRGGIK